MNRRVLVIDDEERVINTYREILVSQDDAIKAASREIDELTGVVTASAASLEVDYELSSAQQGEEGVELARFAFEMGRPFAVALVDMRMPPGIDGLQTAERLREIDPDIYVVLVTAYTDRSVEEIQQTLQYDAMLLYKPFTADEILQLIRTLCISWNNRREKEEAFLEVERLASYPQEHPSPVLRFSESGELLYHNPHSGEVLAMMEVDRPGERLVGSWLKLIQAVYQDGRGLEIEVGNGDHFYLFTLAPIHDKGYINCYVQDITRRYTLNRQLSYQARHDPLTGLPNRREFIRKLNLTIRRVHEEGGEHALLYLDLEHFKQINDTAGHLVGDQVLQTLSGHLLNELKDGDILCRIGGDEFSMLIFQVTPEQAYKVGQRFCAAVQKNIYQWQGLEFSLDVNVGIAMVTQENLSDAKEMINRADQACFVAREKGRDQERIHLYQQDRLADEVENEAVVLAGEVRDAITSGYFQLYLQPIAARANASSEQLMSEVLLRMTSSSGKVVAPAEFIPNSERFDLMPLLDRWVITETLIRAGQEDHLGSEHRYSINLSGSTLVSEGFVLFVRDQLEQHRVRAANIIFEIPESVVYSRMSAVQRFITEMHKLGVLVAVEGYGSVDRSPLNLQKLPFDLIKIDARLTQGVTHNQVERALLESIQHIGLMLGMELVATAVEDEKTAGALDRIGVQYQQGYLTGKPRPWG